MRLLGKILHTTSRSKSLNLALFGIILGAVGILSVFALSGTVYAAGGVGSGGSGSGGSGGTGNWSRYGWGWAIYNTSSAGPHDGFHNGTSWASVQATCNAAGAPQVYAFDINDNNGNAMVYDYQTVFESPSQYAAHFPAYSIVDNGNAVSVNTFAPGGVPGEVDAASAFAVLQGVDTTGYTFGVNVAWFCAGFSAPHPSTPPSISATCDATGNINVTDANYPNDSPPITERLYSGGVNGGNPWPPTGSSEHVVGIAGTPDGHGYWEVTNIGGVFAFGDAGYHGSSGQVNPGLPAGGANSFSVSDIVGIASSPDGGGYLMVGADGGVFAFGDAGYHGSSGQVNPGLPAGGANSFVPSSNIVGIALGSGANGYWMLDKTGHTYAFNETYFTNVSNSSMSSIASTPDGGGYWLVGTDGSIYNYGDAGYVTPAGSGTIIGISGDPAVGKSGGVFKGYRTVNTIGDIFDYGGATYKGGSPWGVSNVVGLETTPDGQGYVLVGSDGGIFNYGSAGFYGSTQPAILATATLNGASSSLVFNASPWTNVTNSTLFVITATNTSGQKSTTSVTCAGTPNHPTITCGYGNTSPSTVGAGQNFSYIATVNYSWPNNTSNQITGYITVTINGVSKNSPTATASASPYSGTVNNFKISTPGVYSSSFSFTPTSPATTTNNATNCPGQQVTVVDEPYFQVSGSDTSVGVRYCTDRNPGLPGSNPNAKLYGWNSPTFSGTNYDQGAGDQFGIFAPDIINGFASGRGLAGSPTGLSFANTGNTSTNSLADTIANNNFGGYFGSLPACNYDYFSDNPSGAQLITPISPTTSLTGLASGSYYINSPGAPVYLSGTNVVNWGATGNQGQRAIVYVNGNVVINGDITYPSPPGISSSDQIPSFELIVLGNITINGSVGEVDGTYIAEPRSVAGTDGIIYTCDVSPASSGSSCISNLVVKGSLSANTVKFWRTSGSAGDGSIDPAETVNYSPRVWLTQEPSTSTGSTNTHAKTNSITSLPPIL
jgi:hypothetical protein